MLEGSVTSGRHAVPSWEKVGSAERGFSSRSLQLEGDFICLHALPSSESTVRGRFTGEQREPMNPGLKTEESATLRTHAERIRFLLQRFSLSLLEALRLKKVAIDSGIFCCRPVCATRTTLSETTSEERGKRPDDEVARAARRLATSPTYALPPTLVVPLQSSSVSGRKPHRLQNTQRITPARDESVVVVARVDLLNSSLADWEPADGNARACCFFAFILRVVESSRSLCEGRAARARRATRWPVRAPHFPTLGLTLFSHRYRAWACLRPR